MNVRWTVNDVSTILTATWDRVTAAQGFSFWRDNLRVSYTMDGTRTSTRFGLDGKPHTFEVRSLVASDNAVTTYPLPSQFAVSISGVAQSGHVLTAKVV